MLTNFFSSHSYFVPSFISMLFIDLINLARSHSRQEGTPGRDFSAFSFRLAQIYTREMYSADPPDSSFFCHKSSRTSGRYGTTWLLSRAHSIAAGTHEPGESIEVRVLDDARANPHVLSPSSLVSLGLLASSSTVLDRDRLKFRLIPRFRIRSALRNIDPGPRLLARQFVQGSGKGWGRVYNPEAGSIGFRGDTPETAGFPHLIAVSTEHSPRSYLPLAKIHRMYRR